MNKTPKSFKLFGTTVKMITDNQRCNDMHVYGFANYGMSEILLSTHQNEEKLSEGKMLDTFYHERTHLILDTMGENELSSNEKFVDIFSKLLRQSDETMKF